MKTSLTPGKRCINSFTELIFRWGRTTSQAKLSGRMGNKVLTQLVDALLISGKVGCYTELSVNPVFRREWSSAYPAVKGGCACPTIRRWRILSRARLMMNWTNDRWISTLHRVVPPLEDLTSRRQSIPFFFNPNPDAMIACLESCQSPDNPAKYPPVLAGEHHNLKKRKSLGEIAK